MKKGANQGSPAASSVKNSEGRGGGERHLVRRSGPIPIPKHITTSGEKYVICCLELIHDYAVGGSSLNLSKLNACLVDSDVYDMASFLIENPVAAGDDLMIGDSRRMRKVLSPLLKQFGSAKFNACVLGINEPVHSASASLQFRCLLSVEPENTVVGDYESITSRSYRASLPGSIQGTLHCKRKNGVYHHVFSAGDDKNLYTAMASQVESSSDKALECVYTFYAGRKEAIATMRVFTSITLRSSMELIRKTKFILYASSDDHHHEEINLSNSNKSRLTRKKASLFRSGSFLQQRSISRASVQYDKTVADLSEEDQSSVQQDEVNDLTSHEIAAIVLRETCYGPGVADMGGWGLKFLKPRNDPLLETLEVEPSENTRNNGGCSTSMNVLIPAGIHGKPNDKSGGPSSLVDRWISPGGCDCGGWDIGCPLTVLVPKQSNSDSSAPGKCMPVHLFIQASRQEAPVLKMESIRDGSYSIHFQSMLSNLQSFAIAVAVVHSKNPQHLHWN